MFIFKFFKVYPKNYYFYGLIKVYNKYIIKKSDKI